MTRTHLGCSTLITAKVAQASMVVQIREQTAGKSHLSLFCEFKTATNPNLSTQCSRLSRHCRQCIPKHFHLPAYPISTDLRRPQHQRCQDSLPLGSTRRRPDNWHRHSHKRQGDHLASNRSFVHGSNIIGYWYWYSGKCGLYDISVRSEWHSSVHSISHHCLLR